MKNKTTTITFYNIKWVVQNSTLPTKYTYRILNSEFNGELVTECALVADICSKFGCEMLDYCLDIKGSKVDDSFYW